MIGTFSGQIWDAGRNLKNFPILEAIGHFPDWYEGGKKKSLFSLTNGTLLSLYGTKEEKMKFFLFQLSKQLFSGQICCGRRKIKKFTNLVMKLPVAVPIWSGRENFSSKWEAKCRFRSLYGMKDRLYFRNKSAFSVLIWCRKKKMKRFLPKCTVSFVLMM